VYWVTPLHSIEIFGESEEVKEKGHPMNLKSEGGDLRTINFICQQLVVKLLLAFDLGAWRQGACRGYERLQPGTYLINQAPTQRSSETRSHWLRSSQEFTGVLIRPGLVL